MKRIVLVLGLAFAAASSHADGVDALKSFVRDVNSARAQFTQTVTAPDGARKKSSSGSFEFARPNRFRFVYSRPFEQVIVADGRKVWIYDADLNQASSRKFSSAIGATPAALLAGGALDKDFDLAPLPAKDGLDWVLATPKVKDGAFKSVRVGFRGKELAAVEIVDAFDQHSLLTFSQFTAGVQFADDAFRFTPPAGADVIEQ
ncbi:MAG: outer membrane lipoprotein chaperone LolA [Burkholderiaceae bacterium]